LQRASDGSTPCGHIIVIGSPARSITNASSMGAAPCVTLPILPLHLVGHQVRIEAVTLVVLELHVGLAERQRLVRLVDDLDDEARQRHQRHHRGVGPAAGSGSRRGDCSVISAIAVAIPAGGFGCSAGALSVHTRNKDVR
jgi:hypothetical protein